MKNKADKYAVIDKFGEGKTVADYENMGDAIDAARNINRTTGHRTTVYLGDISVTNFPGREYADGGFADFECGGNFDGFTCGSDADSGL